MCAPLAGSSNAMNRKKDRMPVSRRLRVSDAGGTLSLQVVQQGADPAESSSAPLQLEAELRSSETKPNRRRKV